MDSGQLNILLCLREFSEDSGSPSLLSGMGIFNFLLPAKVVVTINTTSNFSSGGIVKGSVFLEIKNDSVDADALRLRFTGAERTTVSYYTGSGKHRKHHHAHGLHTIVDLDINIMQFQSGTVKKGQYYHPFEFRLPTGLPGSASLSNGEHRFAVNYALEARLHRTGMFSFDVKHRTDLLMANQSSNITVPQYLVPVTHKITQFCCIEKGSMTIAAKLQSNTVRPNQSVQLNYAFINNSTSTTKAIVIQVWEKAYIVAGRHRATIERCVYERRIHGSEILNAERLSNLKCKTKDNSEKTLIDVLNSNKQVISVDISPGSLNDYDGTIIDVNHKMVVSLRSPFCISDPEFSIPFFIKGNACDFVANDMAADAAPRAPEGWDGKAGPTLYIEAPVIYASAKAVYDTHEDSEESATLPQVVVTPSSQPLVPPVNRYMKLPFGDFFPPYVTALDKGLAASQWAETEGGIDLSPEQLQQVIAATPGAHLKVEVSSIIGAAMQKRGALTCKHALCAAKSGLDNANKSNIVSCLHPMVNDKQNGFIFNELNLGMYFAMTVAN